MPDLNHNNDDDDTTTTKKQTTSSLLDEMMESMAHSMLIFLVADIRLMSATGRIATPYECMAVDSDTHVRASAEDMACRLPITTTTTTKTECKELAPSQCMALVLMEMRNSFAHVNEKLQNDNNKEDLTRTVHADGGTFTNFIGTVKGRTKKKYKREWQSDMHKLLKAYADMIGNDLKERVPYIEARQSMLNLATSLHGTNNNNNINKQSSQSSKKNLKAVPEGDGEEKENEEIKQENEENDHDGVNVSQSDVRSSTSQSNLRSSNLRRTVFQQTMIANRDKLLLSRDQRDVKHMEQVTDTLFNMNIRQESAAAEALLLGVRPSPNATLTGAQLMQMLQKATMTRDASKLSFMGKFFREGTLSHLMVQSQARFVWVNDFYPLKDLTYAIGIDREKKRVLVVFRGAITRQDWATVTYVHQTKVKNPIPDDFDGKPATVNIHSGFYRYLFRVRKDTGTTSLTKFATWRTNMAWNRLATITVSLLLDILSEGL